MKELSWFKESRVSQEIIYHTGPIDLAFRGPIRDMTITRAVTLREDKAVASYEVFIVYLEFL